MLAAVVCIEFFITDAVRSSHINELRDNLLSQATLISNDISFKDQELETAFAKQLGVPVLLANVTQQVYQMARAAGLNKEDGSAVVKILERLAGVTVKGGA